MTLIARTFTVSLFATALSAQAFPTANPESLGYSRAKLSRLADALAKWVDDGQIAGGELLVIADGRTILHEVAGQADRERGWPMKKDTVFRIQSMSKAVLGTAALLLVEAGALELEAPVHRYIPEFDVPSVREITVRQLLSHTAGLTYDDYNAEVWRGEHPTRMAAIEALIEHGPAYPPGSKFSYENGNSDTLAEVVERAAKMPAGELIANRVFEPLGMGDSFVLPPAVADRGERFASAYVRRDDRLLRYWDAGESPGAKFFRGAGGIYSTPKDFARLLALWIGEGATGGRQLLQPQTVREALTPTELSLAAEHGYGLHWRIFARPPDSRLVFGHGGSDGTIAIAIPERRLIVAFFTQTRQSPTVAALLAMTPEALAETEAIRGPVTKVIVTDGTTWSASRPGVFVETGGTRTKLEHPAFRVFDFDVHGDLLVAVGGRPGQTGEVACVRRLEHQVAYWKAGSDLVYAVAIAGDGATAALGLADGRVFEVGLPKLEPRRELKRHSAACRAVAYDGDRLVTAGLDGNLVVYDRDPGVRVITAHTAGIDCLLLDGEYALSGARDGRVRMHEIDTGRLVRTYLRLGDRVNALCAHPEGGWLAGLRDGRLVRLNPGNASFEVVKQFDTPIHAVCRDRTEVIVGLRDGTRAWTPR